MKKKTPSNPQYGGLGYLSRDSDWLWPESSGDRIPVMARFSTPVQAGPAAQPLSCEMGQDLFSGVNPYPTNVENRVSS